MEHGNAIPGKTWETLTLDVRKTDWSVRITHALDPGGASLLLSLPSGLFVAHDREMSRAGAGSGRTAVSDTDFLVGMWGFTRVTGDELTEIGDVAVLGVGVREGGLAVSLAGYPWLLADAGTEIPAEWAAPGAAASCLVGICFDIDLAVAEADDLFWSQLIEGQAVLGQANVMLRM
ncbi:hypothetical protein GCM10010339_52020 [Streptomyces alanosinicus]|uniref:Uncharacterized protein n=1 Tax=Streptomyces alanosinicus TaxID=68171 RepID=A0A919D4D3_9ACTN|nr:hypothetical protein GCM10010339_52020 [Streptomyces alanosinicus]